MEKPIKIVLDTSIFVNPDSRYTFGQTPQQALQNFIKEFKELQDVSCFIPPSVYAELMKFMETPVADSETITIEKRPPSSYDGSIPALFVYDFIEEMRIRINKGLRICEKYARKSLKIPPTDDRSIEEEIIKSAREEYRNALREGVVDSKEDFDLILLAKELSAHIATSDKGLIEWAAKLGIPCLSAPELKELTK
jgi:RNA ligase partner protein